jgi:integrin beta 8
VNGAPGPRGEEGLRGKQGKQGNGSSEVFVLHSYNSTVPRCPMATHTLWEGYSLGPGSAGSTLNKGISNPGTCMRQFSLLQTLANLGHASTASVWHAAGDVDGVESGKTVDEPTARKMAARCSVCEVERSLLTLHSGSTQLPQCPQGWESLWRGFTRVTSTVRREIPTTRHGQGGEGYTSQYYCWGATAPKILVTRFGDLFL